MGHKFILTAFSKDRPGIVADISEVIFENECNLEDSTMTNMLDEFAIILLFSGKGNGLEDQLLKDCRRLEKEKGITAFIRAVDANQTEKYASVNTKTISVEGIDQSGIVYRVSKYLASNDINISSLNSRRFTSPGAGTIHYFMEIKVQIPEKMTIDKFEEGISKVGEELNLEITVQ